MSTGSRLSDDKGVSGLLPTLSGGAGAQVSRTQVACTTLSKSPEGKWTVHQVQTVILLG